MFLPTTPTPEVLAEVELPTTLDGAFTKVDDAEGVAMVEDDEVDDKLIDEGDEATEVSDEVASANLKGESLSPTTGAELLEVVGFSDLRKDLGAQVVAGDDDNEDDDDDEGRLLELQRRARLQATGEGE